MWLLPPPESNPCPSACACGSQSCRTRNTCPPLPAWAMGTYSARRCTLRSPGLHQACGLSWYPSSWRAPPPGSFHAAASWSPAHSSPGSGGKRMKWGPQGCQKWTASPEGRPKWGLGDVPDARDQRKLLAAIGDAVGVHSNLLELHQDLSIAPLPLAATGWVLTPWSTGLSLVASCCMASVNSARDFWRSTLVAFWRIA